MSKDLFSDNKFTRFLSGKGFYAILALCLAGAGTAAYLAVSHSPSVVVDPKDQTNITQISEAPLQAFPSFEDAAKSQPNVAVPSPSSSQPPKQEQQQSPSSKPADESEPSAEQVSSQTLSFVLPLNGEIMADYSGGELVKNETLNDWRTHNGIDIRAEKGTQVSAVAAGTVRSIQNDPLWGYVIEIDHGNGLVSSYCGLSQKTEVKEGDQVVINQVIGTVEYIPCESLLDNHLHFEMKLDGQYVDPLSTMNK